MTGRIGKFKSNVAFSGAVSWARIGIALACIGAHCLLPTVSRAQAPDFRWVRQFGGVGYYPPAQSFESMDNLVYSLAADRNGNSLIAGWCNTLNPSFVGANSTNLVGPGGYVVKVDPAGNMLWAKSTGTNGFLFGVTADASGNVYTGGLTAVTWSDTAVAQGNAVLTKYDLMGNVVWSVQGQGDLQDEANQLAVDAATNIYVSGRFTSTNLTFGSITLTNSHLPQDPSDLDFEAFTAKFDSSGNALWATTIAAPHSLWSTVGPNLDAAGNVIVAGILFNTITLGTTTLTNIGAGDIYVVKYDTAGNLMWAKDVGVGDFSGGANLSVDLAGNIYLGARFQSSTATFGNFTVTNNAGTIVLAKYDGNGNAVWVRQAKGNYNDGSEGEYGSGSVFADRAGNVYQAAVYEGTSIDFGGLILPSVSGEYEVNAYVAKYDGAGDILWAREMFTPDGGFNLLLQPGCLTGDAYGNIFVAGNFWTRAIFGKLSVTPANPYEVFLAKLDGPQLSLQAMGNQMVIAWPTNATGLNLESTSTFGGGGWSPVTNNLAVVGTQYVVTNQVSMGAQFFRLRNF
jgi:hypothetical protein